MDELQYSMGDDLRSTSEDTFSVSPTLKPRVSLLLQIVNAKFLSSFLPPFQRVLSIEK